MKSRNLGFYIFAVVTSSYAVIGERNLQQDVDEQIVHDVQHGTESDEQYMKFVKSFENMTLREISEFKQDHVPLASRRNLQSVPVVAQEEVVHIGTAADFLAPCVSLPAENPRSAGWIQIDNEGFAGDDGSVSIDLGFDFSLYGSIWSRVTISVNGYLTFGDTPGFIFSPSSFPVAFNIIAPFWSDVDARAVGEVWYKNFGTHLVVIWDRVGHFVDFTGSASERLNTFQAVISSNGDGSVLGGNNNICFCYVDMDWWTGAFSPNAPAIVGVNNIDNGEYTQIGRFFGDGTAYDGPGGLRDGVDWLDFQGSTLGRGNNNAPMQGLCFDAQTTANVSPVAMGFPVNDTVAIECGGSLNLTLTFSTPETDQSLELISPSNLDSIPNLVSTIVIAPGQEAIAVTISFEPDFSTQSGPVVLTFTVRDDFTRPATITRTLTINVAEQCQMAKAPMMGDDESDDGNTYCLQVEGSTCTANTKPVCVPFRSPEHCPQNESFPLLIRERNGIVSSNPAYIEEQGYWFHNLEDKAAAKAFTSAAGYPTLNLLCCTDTIESFLFDCAPTLIASEGFVIRAVGEQHSSMAVYVLPTGFSGPELIRQQAIMTLAQVQANLEGLRLPPNKIIVEEFVSGSTTEATLPNEYKIHAFNGNVGAINMILNRGTDCGCYAEVDTSWNRLDRYGCFVPSMPFGQEFDNDDTTTTSSCYGIDFEEGARRPYPMKGFDLCGAIAKPPCVVDEMIRIAQEISLLIGVYVRIDFFVGADNSVYVQEYSLNHNNGLRHCSAREEAGGCIDSCFLGRMWNENSASETELAFGGPLVESSILGNWRLSPDQCGIVQNQTGSMYFIQQCTAAATL